MLKCSSTMLQMIRWSFIYCLKWTIFTPRYFFLENHCICFSKCLILKHFKDWQTVKKALKSERWPAKTTYCDETPQGSALVKVRAKVLDFYFVGLLAYVPNRKDVKHPKWLFHGLGFPILRSTILPGTCLICTEIVPSQFNVDTDFNELICLALPFLTLSLH